MIRHALAWLFSPRYRCWSRGEHRYVRQSRIVDTPGTGRVVLDRWRVWRYRCRCCGRIKPEKSPKRKKIDWFNSVSMPDSYWEKLRRLGYLPRGEWEDDPE